MALVHSEEQTMLREMAREFCGDKLPVSELRALRDDVHPDGFSRASWAEMAELGWAGIPFDEALGGAGLGYVELGSVLEQMGHTLAASPIFASVVAGGSALALAGDEAQRKRLLTRVCAGEQLLALAHQESARFAPYQIATRAEASEGGYRLSGKKRFVLDGHVADTLVVVARSHGADGERAGLGLFLVDASAPGVHIDRTSVIDGRNAASVLLDGVEVTREAALGSPGDAADALDGVLDRCALAIAAESLGLLDEAFQITLQFLKDRQQFGVPIGSFQALKHRAAYMFVELELLRSVVLDGLQAIDEGREDVSHLASIAKVRAADAALLVSNECVQMHGGLGVTDEQDIGLYLKRARVLQLSFGDASFHRDRFAALSGY